MMGVFPKVQEISPCVRLSQLPIGLTWTVRIVLVLWCCVGLGGCVSQVNSDLPVSELARLELASPVEITASASDPTSKLPVEVLPAGYEVEMLGVDTTGAWLLIFDGDFVGWMPGFFSATPIARLKPPLVIEPLDAACARYMGATFDQEEPWVSSSDETIIVEGSIYRPQAGLDFMDANLEIFIEGAGDAVAAEYVHVPLTPYSSIVLFAYALEGMEQGSRVTFGLDDPSAEPVIFQASFFTERCGTDLASTSGRFKSRMPVGEISLDLPVQTSTPTPRSHKTPTVGPSPTPVTVKIESGDRLRAPTRAEIQSLVDQWDRIHHAADFDLDPADLPLVLTSGALRQQKETLESLRASNCYWEFSDISPSRITRWEEISVNEVIVTMRKHWDGRLYCKGRYNAKESFDDPFDVRYQIVRTSQGWRIAEKVPLD